MMNGVMIKQNIIIVARLNWGACNYCLHANLFNAKLNTVDDI